MNVTQIMDEDDHRIDVNEDGSINTKLQVGTSTVSTANPVPTQVVGSLPKVTIEASDIAVPVDLQFQNLSAPLPVSLPGSNREVITSAIIAGATAQTLGATLVAGDYASNQTLVPIDISDYDDIMVVAQNKDASVAVSALTFFSTVTATSAAYSLPKYGGESKFAPAANSTIIIVSSGTEAGSVYVIPRFANPFPGLVIQMADSAGKTGDLVIYVLGKRRYS